MDQELLAWAKGLVAGACEHAEVDPFLTLRFGDGRLTVQSAWRLVREHEIIVASSEKRAEMVEPLVAHVVGAKVVWLDVKGPFHDLLVGFDSNFLLETFGESCRFEHWEISGGVDPSVGPSMLVAGPGHLWSSFGMPAAPLRHNPGATPR